jgi:DNA-binding MarR family transcriptional regulator
MSAENKPDGYSRVEHELAILLRRAQANSGDLAFEVHLDLQASAYALLARLHDLGGARAADLRDYFGIDKGALSRQLKLLEDLQLITRRTDAEDRRCHQLSLTADGHRQLAEARAARHRLIRRELSRWASADVETFGDLLGRFNSSAGQETGAHQDQ